MTCVDETGWNENGRRGARFLLQRRPAWPGGVQLPASVSSASPVTRTMRHSGSTVAPIFS